MQLFTIFNTKDIKFKINLSTRLIKMYYAWHRIKKNQLMLIRENFMAYKSFKNFILAFPCEII